MHGYYNKSKNYCYNEIKQDFIVTVFSLHQLLLYYLFFNLYLLFRLTYIVY